MNTKSKNIRYGGFWVRFWASMVDSILLLIIIAPISWHIYGIAYFSTPYILKGPGDFLTTWVLPFVATFLFWKFRAATPGKMLLGLVIADADTLQQPSSRQLVVRYLGYFVSTFFLCLGFLWIAFDRRKQGWHDKLADTVVVKKACLK